jgi:preprotein translocase subunit YajC
MLISPAYAQGAGPSGGFDIISLLPLILIFVVFYFLLIRPQQQKARQHRAMVDALKKGDQVLTAGGILGKVTKVDAGENTAMVEIAQGVQVKVARHTITELLNKPAPAPAAAPAGGPSNENQAAAAPSQAASAAPAGESLISRLFKK